MVMRLCGRCPRRIGFPFGPLVAAAFTFSLLFQPFTVSADAIPYAADITGYWGKGTLLSNAKYTMELFPTQEAACRRAMFDSRGFPLTGTTYSHFTYITPGYGECWYFSVILFTPTHPNPFDPAYENLNQWARQLACPRGGYPLDPNAETPMCSCPPGQEFPAAPDWLRGPWCVPATTPTCPIPPIPPYTPDPYPALIEELTPRVQTALSCLQAAIDVQGGTSIFNSGYRPVPYNDHLRAVWDKWEEVKNDKRPECQALRAEVAAEIALHKMIKEPAMSSNHTLREAVDLSSSLTRGTLDGLAINCGLFRPLPLTDKPHFEPLR